MKIYGILISFLLGIANPSYAQKIIEKEIDAATISIIEINSDLLFKVTIVSEKAKKIKLRLTVDGENFENTLLSIHEKDGHLLIAPGFSPFFEAKNDKLSAHKVLALELALIVPEEISIKINSKLASVNAKGNFTSIEAILDSGNCLLDSFKGDANLKTQKGFIKVYTSELYKGYAKSRKGTVINELTKKGDYTIEAESFEGDVSLFLIE